MKRQRWLCVLVLGLSSLCWVGCRAPEAPAGTAPTGDTPVEEAQKAWFLEEAAERGLVFQMRSGSEDRFLFPEIFPSGVALFDRDEDGDLDVYLVQGGSLKVEGNPNGANQLYDNDGSGHFTNITKAVAPATLGMAWV
jgi:hypothetical protein